MSSTVLSASPILEEINQQISARIKELGRAPRMAILRAVSDSYAVYLEKQIVSACRDSGVEPWSMELPAYLQQDVLVSSVHKVGQDPSIDGVALICPEQYDLGLLGAAIGEDKDVGGLLRSASARFLPCFDSAILRVLQYYDIPLKGKNITIAGYSESKHFILKSILALQGASVSQVGQFSEANSACFKNSAVLFSSVAPSELLNQGCLENRPFVFFIGTGYYGESMLDRGDISPILSKTSGIFPLPEGIDLIIPYIYAYNTAFSAQKR